MKTNHGFRRAVVFSAIVHGALLLLLLISPSLPKPVKKGSVYYLPLNLVSPSGGGGGGGPSVKAVKTSSKQASLRDLTTPQKKTVSEAKSALRYPVEKKKAIKKASEKTTVISKPEPEAASSKSGEASGGLPGGGTGAGIRIGVGPGPGGPGGGWGEGDFGLSSFPFSYYLQIIQDRVSVNWFTSLIDPGVVGQFQCVVFFRILRDGRIADLQIETSSGLKSLDLSALRAVHNATPFPPLPREFEGDSLGIHLIFEHSR
ncbi:MAG: energy transducer TonB [Candidatus Aminicenantales bacterium]